MRFLLSILIIFSFVSAKGTTQNISTLLKTNQEYYTIAIATMFKMREFKKIQKMISKNDNLFVFPILGKNDKVFYKVTYGIYDDAKLAFRAIIKELPSTLVSTSKPVVVKLKKYKEALGRLRASTQKQKILYTISVAMLPDYTKLKGLS